MTNEFYETCDVTYDGLQKWYESVFEKYGWILLMSKKYPDSLKIQSYLEGINRLYHRLCCYKNQTLDLNKKKDLSVMKKNLKIIFGEYIYKNKK